MLRTWWRYLSSVGYTESSTNTLASTAFFGLIKLSEQHGKPIKLLAASQMSPHPVSQMDESGTTCSRWRLASVTCDRCLLKPLDTKQRQCVTSQCAVYESGASSLLKRFLIGSCHWFHEEPLKSMETFDLTMFFIVYYLQIIEIFITLRKIR